MSLDPLPVTSHRLTVNRLLRAQGGVLLVMACVLGTAVGLRLATLLPLVRYVQAQIAGMGRTYVVSDEGVIVLALLTATAVFTVPAIVHCIVGLVSGVNKLLLPVGAPLDAGILSGARVVLDQLFRHRVISEYCQPTPLMRLAASIISRRYIYARNEVRDLARQMCVAVVILLVLLAVSAILLVCRTSATPVGWWERFVASWAFPTHLVEVTGFVVVILFLAVLASIPRVPQVEVKNANEHLSNTGNPVNFFNHLLATSARFAHEHHPNSILAESAPSLGKIVQGESDEYSAEVLLETQAIPAAAGGTPLNAVILDVGGASLRCVGYAILIFFPEILTLPLNSMDGATQFVLLLLGGVLAVRTGTHLLKSGNSLHRIVKFESDVFWLSCRGTYTVGNIGLGDGRGGQVYTGKPSVDSEAYVELFGSRVITEWMPADDQSLAKPSRILVDSTTPEDFCARFEHFIQEMREYSDTTSNLPRVNLATPDIEDIVQANAEISHLQRGYPPKDHVPQPEIPSVADSPTGQLSETLKVCPECGEQVKPIARVCRFCRHQFDDKE